MSLNNPFISYAERSYLTIKSAIIDKIKNPTIGIPEITDYSEGNGFIKQVGIWSGISEQLGYFLNKKARERFISTCRLYKNMVKHAKAHDYRIHGVSASSGTVIFTMDDVSTEAATIPAGTKLRTSQGIVFLTLSEAVIQINETQVEVDVKQWEEVPQYTWGQSSGETSIEIELESGVVDKSMTVTVAGTQVFTAVDTFAFSKPTDQVYVPGLNEDKIMIIKFGDGITGQVPQSSADIEISYYTSLGLSGNVPENSITEIVGTISLPPGRSLTVNNESQTNGGADVESLEELRVNIPRSIRTMMRAVTPQDFIDIAILAPGVAKSEVSYSSTTGVTSYIVPVGGGIASSVLLDSVEDFFEGKRAVQTVVKAQSVGEVRLKINAIINVKSGYNRADTINIVKTNLLSLLSWENAEIGGKLVLGDVYEVIEGTNGVLNSQIISTNIIPYASPSDPGTIQLNWTIDVIDPGTQVQTYKIQFTNTTTYNLYKNNNFIATYSVEDTVTFDDIEFQIFTDSYETDDIYTFNTYPKPDLNAGIITLDEYSIIVSNSEDLILTGTGGIV